MQRITDIQEMQRTADRLRIEGKRIGFVPTMGFLHAGHLDLLRVCREQCDIVVLSVFVNPAQFGKGEDFGRYPRDPDRDEALAASAGCDIVFIPNSEDIYPPDASTRVEVEGLSELWEGRFRPTHFRGVTTVVSLLFHIVKPHCAVFGQKDIQQAVIIRRMVRDLHFDIEIIVAPTRRENDGLAMSSRNTYLAGSGRSDAAVLSRALRLAEQAIAGGERNTAMILAIMHDELAGSPDIKLDYAAVFDAETLEEIIVIDKAPVVIAIAARIGNTRLIDNTIVKGETIES
ncbi:MAG: pantoate--beta-alanine ligase [Bacteroidetes bacterium]|nr:pantoate--beta-alanine ligase [Bacteroidota bacterium]